MLLNVKKWFAQRFGSGVVRTSSPRDRNVDANYYQVLHDRNKNYKSNNWLIDQAKLFELIKGNSFAEIGAGNCQFSIQAGTIAREGYAIDWARSASVESLPSNVRFIQGNILEMEIPQADVYCSGDVIEHFQECDVAPLLLKLHRHASINYHVIACFDDHHSHLTIKDKEWWLEQFQKISTSYRLLNSGHESRNVAIISNF